MIFVIICLFIKNVTLDILSEENPLMYIKHRKHLWYVTFYDLAIWIRARYPKEPLISTQVLSMSLCVWWTLPSQLCTERVLQLTFGGWFPFFLCCKDTLVFSGSIASWILCLQTDKSSSSGKHSWWLKLLFSVICHKYRTKSPRRLSILPPQTGGFPSRNPWVWPIYFIKFFINVVKEWFCGGPWGA